MPVNVVGQARREFGELRGVAGDDAGEIHHLCHSDDARVAQQALDVAQSEGLPRGLKA